MRREGGRELARAPTASRQSSSCTDSANSFHLSSPARSADVRSSPLHARASVPCCCCTPPEFKKIPDEAKVEAIKSLLKAYQGEIDQLTRRSKVSESAFLNTYKLLAEAPDPYPLLDAAVVR